MSTPYNNSFYEKLQTMFDSKADLKIDLHNSKVTANPKPADRVNVSGNLKLDVLVPLDENAPNYCESIIKSKLELKGCLDIIIGTLMNVEFIANPTTSNLKASPAGTNAFNNAIKYVQNNPEPLLEMLKKNSTNPLYAWNLNYGRNITATKVKQIAAHVINRFNAVIDYVISNDVKKPDTKFRDLVRDIFATNKNEVYNFSHYTLMLPALVNYFASNGANNPTEHATRYTGIVKKGSGLHPKTNNVQYDQEVKWHKSGETIVAGSVCPYAILNNGTPLINVGEYNYPFTDANKAAAFHPKFIDVPTNAEDPAAKNISFPCTVDNYRYNDNTPNTVMATTPMNKDDSARGIPPPTYGSRNLDWNTEFTAGSFQTQSAVLCHGQGSVTNTGNHVRVCN